MNTAYLKGQLWNEDVSVGCDQRNSVKPAQYKMAYRTLFHYKFQIEVPVEAAASVVIEVE